MSKRLEIVTPEGVPIHFEIADLGSRFGALLIDFFIMFSINMVLGLTSLFLSWLLNTNENYFAAILTIAQTLVIFFYHTLFEIRSQGSTPGKRAARIRVISDQGRSLTNVALFARNLTRQIEIFFPFILIAWLEEDYRGSGPLVWLALSWLLGISLLPVFTKKNQRLGDLFGGTVVIKAPKVRLLRDLTSRSDATTADFKYTFTREELELYGIYELQTLEQVLRQSKPDPKILLRIRKTIERKMGRSSSGNSDDKRFLNDLYIQLRAQLEQRLLFGERREHKKAGRLKQEKAQSIGASRSRKR